MTDAAATGGATTRARPVLPVREQPVIDLRRAVLWLPISLGFGVWIYFALPMEPPGWTAGAALLPLLWLLGGRWRRGGALGLVLALLLTAAASGYALALWSTTRAAAPVLPRPMTLNIEGRVIELGRSASGAPRVLLDRVVLHGVERHATPRRARVTLLAADHAEAPRPGTRIMAYARLSPPGSPVEPGAFDFRLRAWFEQLGAIGYARDPPVTMPPRPAGGWRDRATLWLAKQRLRLADGLRAALPGAEGAFAAALVVGDRSAIAPGDAEALRRANLAHLLAISGLHMGILTGLIFAGLRVGLAPLAGIGRRISTRKLAAALALAGGAAYLALSGATVATQRAFIMVAVALVAVMIDRPAISLRALAVAAVIVLVIRPVSLLEVGFQMSFAATAALVAGWEAWRQHRPRRREVSDRLPARILRTLALYALGVLFTSLLAGMATAPYAAYHFNRTAPWGLLANLAAVPAMGLAIAPAAIVAGLAAPLGLEGPALWLMGQGIAWVLGVAHWVADLPGAVRPVPAAGPHVLWLMTLGGLWLCLCRGRWRLAGAAAIVMAAITWSAGAARPVLLVAPEASLVGLLGPEGRSLSSERAQSFAADTWLRRDGDLTEQRAAGRRPGLERGRGRTGGTLPNGWRVEVVRSRRPDGDLLRSLCRERVLLIVRSGRPLDGPCLYLGRRELLAAGAVAVYPEGDALRLQTGQTQARRPWHGAARR